MAKLETKFRSDSVLPLTVEEDGNAGRDSEDVTGPAPPG